MTAKQKIHYNSAVEWKQDYILFLKSTCSATLQRSWELRSLYIDVTWCYRARYRPMTSVAAGRQNGTLIVPKFFTEYSSGYLEQSRLESLSRRTESALYVRFPGTYTWHSSKGVISRGQEDKRETYAVICNDFSYHWENS